MSAPLKVIYMGTPDISVPALELLNSSDLVDLKLVISMPDRPAGRGRKLKSPEVIEFSKENSINFYQSENINKDENLKKIIEEIEPDLIIVFAFAQFLSSFYLNIPRIGCFNIHTSLLPKYRGAAPIHYAILNNDKETGVSIQRMVKKMDAGDIAHLKKVSIEEDETTETLYQKLKDLSKDALEEFITQATNEDLTFTPQDENLVSFAPTISKNDGLINFKDDSSVSITSKLKAFTPWPGIFTYLNNKRMRILDIEEGTKKLKPGELNIEQSTLLVGCSDKSIRLKSVQLEGKKTCTDTELLNGLRNKYESFEIGLGENK